MANFFVFPTLRRDLPAHHKYTRLLNAQEIEINTLQIHKINTDGEITSQTPARFRAMAQALTVFVPRETIKPKAQKFRQT